MNEKIVKPLLAVNGIGDFNYARCDNDGFIMHKFADGMSPRLRLAMAAMQGDWAAQDIKIGQFANEVPHDLLEQRARLYFRMADAMLAADKEGK